MERDLAKKNDFFVRFWGVRGSIACPGANTARYGGNTSCLEVRCGAYLFILDAGTGLRCFDRSIAAGEALDADVLLTHTHLDHIWGWPYFTRLMRPDTRLSVWAGNLLNGNGVEHVLGGLLRDPFQPVREGLVRARVMYHDFHAGETLEPRPGVRIRTAPLNHPQGATGYRIEFGGRSVCYVTDTEHTPGARDRNILDLVRSADAMIYDSNYTEAELPAHVGWGHSTWQEGVRLCDAGQVKTFVAFHHDPDHDDRRMDELAIEIERARPGSVVAREGMVIEP